MDDFSGAEGWGRSSAIGGLIPLIDVLLVVLTFLVWVALAPAGPGTPPQATERTAITR